MSRHCLWRTYNFSRFVLCHPNSKCRIKPTKAKPLAEKKCRRCFMGCSWLSWVAIKDFLGHREKSRIPTVRPVLPGASNIFHVRIIFQIHHQRSLAATQIWHKIKLKVGEIICIWRQSTQYKWRANKNNCYESALKSRFVLFLAIIGFICIFFVW